MSTTEILARDRARKQQRDAERERKREDRGPYHSAKKVCERYDIVDRTLDRWLEDPELDFPRPLVINRRRYFSDPELTEWERKRAAPAA
jgi:hypothetical protein